MPHRILRQFLNDERVIRQLADSRFMRGAARIFVSLLFRGKESLQKSSLSRRLTVFSDTFKDEFQKSLKK